MNCNDNYENIARRLEYEQNCLPKYVFCLGATGPTGPSGNAETITIGTVTTGAPGSDASVIDDTGGLNHVLDFVIPRGFDGSSADFCCL